MAIWWSHNQVGCAIERVQITCCYDTIDNIFIEKIVIVNLVAVSSILNGVLKATPEGNGNGIKNAAGLYHRQ
ncbi:unnamed protein product [Albugo candida]|uniref:Uncharacterized protein n=1 Tax=Albugo candida TaxID=65357 RepID=A0A024FX59_9STRA|nr:unnamed protein product [Albugo candida]|eukprot:CCI11249.1 unnamed protein product [Albugo candida]